MPSVPLPEEPDLDQLRAQARDLQRAVRAGDPGPLALVAEHHPAGAPAAADRSGFALSAAQLVVARRHGFASWPRLRRHLDVVARYTRVPGDAPVGGAASDEFLRLACLTYEQDDPARRAEARRLLADHPEIPRAGIHAAAATADVDAVRSFLAADPGSAGREGGPYGWVPLVYMAYARHDPGVAAEPVLATARALLAAGADPDAGFLWHALPTPFTVLTGLFGEGELGPVRQPRHPHAPALARAVLAAGADPNDGQALYNRMFGSDDDHLELLFAFGLGTGGGGPWHRRLGDQLASPAEMLHYQLWWAVGHDQPHRVRLLIEHGVDVRAPTRNGRTPAEVAALAGSPEIVDVLVGHGADRPAFAPVEAFVSAALAVDHTALDRLVAADPGVVAAARAQRPALIADAAHAGRPAAVALLAELGFDVNVADPSGVTALHHAAGGDDVALVEQLLALGASPSIRDGRFDATPLGWAQYTHQDAVAAILEPLT